MGISSPERNTTRVDVFEKSERESNRYKLNTGTTHSHPPYVVSMEIFPTIPRSSLKFPLNPSPNRPLSRPSETPGRAFAGHPHDWRLWHSQRCEA
jgi:hypothetical protein